MSFLRLTKYVPISLFESIRRKQKKFSNDSFDYVIAINETYGMVEYSNISYMKKIKLCASLIYNDIENNNLRYDTNILGLNIFKKYCIDFDSCTLWIKQLNIYVSTEYEDINDACLISSNGNHEYFIRENDIDVYSFPYILENNRIKVASIYINVIDINDPEFKLDAVIEHELKHIYDLYVVKRSEYKLNNDIVYSEKYNLYGKRVNILNRINSVLQFKDLNVKADDICDYILNSVYLLNSSEMQARIINTKSLIFKLDVELLFDIEKLRKNNISLHLLLSRYSSIYKDYYDIHKRLSLCYTLNKELQDIFNNKFLYIFDDIYLKKFKAFKFLILFLINKIDNLYFNHIDKLYLDILYKVNKLNG